MKYPYNVKHNGVWYKAGSEIPEKKQEAKPVKEFAKPKTPPKKAVKPE